MLALIDTDPEGGYNVIDTRDGMELAWKSELPDAAAVAASVNAQYPSGAPAPAYDTLVHEIRMERIGGEPVPTLHALEPRVLRMMIPDDLGGPFDKGLWRPNYKENDNA